LLISCLFVTRTEKDKEDCIGILEKEVNIDFQTAMNKITFDTIVTQNRDQFSFVTIPPRQSTRVPDRGCSADVPAYEFDTSFYNFSFVSLLTRKEAIDALCRVKIECNRAAALSLFQIPNKHMKLEEFEQTQTQQTSQTSLFLKDSWINTLKNGIRGCFLDSGKGWFNIKETDYSVYQISKLKKFMELVKFSMQDSLRFLVQDSLVHYTQMVLDACWQVVDIKESFVWPDDDLVHSSIR
jgi:dynein heavy chain